MDVKCKTSGEKGKATKTSGGYRVKWNSWGHTDYTNDEFKKYIEVL